MILTFAGVRWVFERRCRLLVNRIFALKQQKIIRQIVDPINKVLQCPIWPAFFPFQIGQTPDDHELWSKVSKAVKWPFQSGQ